ncbi:hypothetical protein L0Z16_19375 [Burkholderia multivorans]|uniref:hypothetical protein n=1 Tax=Burkholderia multivorans TaxID=87883 RepID=UPI0020192F5F|nr:hypothetical protein [Burkholderia multivorans]MCL4661387.1 hypothetical protein [Burkholderia multivorans]MCO1352818.1 hypothetical protein [Burkholderia multivorans]MCO1413336.1 hypothetical protein [Burkholderia multivorans]MCO1446473.1 hypothetical protein [Burkholderia multivorans]UQP46885.1 hypothetical protein L0Z16_19375 [Burkholderia multivorans]
MKKIACAVAALLVANLAVAALPLPTLKFVSDNGVCQFYTAEPATEASKKTILATVYTTCNVGGSRMNFAYNPDGSRENLDSAHWSYIDWFEVRCASREARNAGSATFTSQFWKGDSDRSKPSSPAFARFADKNNDVWYGGTLDWVCEKQAQSIPSM